MKQPHDQNNIILKFLPGITSIICMCSFFYMLFTASTSKRIFSSPDYNWIIKTGEWIYKNHGIPHTNILGTNFPQIEHINYVVYQWLFKLVVYFDYKLLGVHGLIWLIISILILSLSVIAVTLYKRKYTGMPEVAVAIIGIIPCLIMFEDLRPFIVTILLASILNFILVYKEKNKVKWVLIPLLFVLWANIHLGFVFGIIWLFIEYLLTAIKNKSFKSMLPLLFTVAVTLINPNGYKLYPYLMTLGSSKFMNNFIMELSPINFHNKLLLVTVILGILTFAYTTQSKAIRPAERIMWVITLTMSLFSIRHLCFLIIIFPVFFAEASRLYLSKYINLVINTENYSKEKDNVILWSLIAIVIGLIFTFNKSFAVPAQRKVLTTGFIKYLNQNPPTSLILTDEFIGSELLFYTKYRAFMDSRFDMYGDKYVQEYYETLLPQAKNWKTLYIKKNIKYIARQNKDLIGTPNLKLLMSNGWKIAYQDKKIIYLIKK
ncbi:MAG: hypothetical protein WCK67_01400 [bacterium]